MRILLALLYIMTLIPSPIFGTTLCISGTEAAIEGFHISSESSSCGDTCCTLGDHHDHLPCVDVEYKLLSVKSLDSIDLYTSQETPSFDSIFASTPFRAPPVSFGKPHELPSRIGLKLKSTAVFLC